MTTWIWVAAQTSPLDIAREANRMGENENFQKIALTCMIFAAMVSTMQTRDNMEDRKWRRRIEEQREERREMGKIR
jgi:hypothetical protein